MAISIYLNYRIYSPMKKTFVLFAIFVCLNAIGQNNGMIVKDDPFTKKLLIKTEKVRITYTGINAGNSLSVGFSLLNGNVLLTLGGNSDVYFTIDKGDKLSFLLDNDSTIDFISPASQSCNPSQVTPYTFDNIYLADSNKINLLIKNPPLSVRIYYCGGNRYIENVTKTSLLPDFVARAKEFMWEYSSHKSPKP